MNSGLVDELHLMIGLALLGDGEPMFNGTSFGLGLLDAEVLDGSRLVLVRYAATT